MYHANNFSVPYQDLKTKGKCKKLIYPPISPLERHCKGCTRVNMKECCFMNDEERKNKRESKGQPSNLFNPQVNMGVSGPVSIQSAWRSLHPIPQMSQTARQAERGQWRGSLQWAQVSYLPASTTPPGSPFNNSHCFAILRGPIRSLFIFLSSASNSFGLSS